ncbi:MAG: aminotransferase class IV [Cyclobacteriaceae bacterium]|nr:aminotransferase class IV [Cyclobacteriaceae bacterium HetDA_MAG_MS6]
MAFCYFDGELMEESQAKLSIHNLGVQRGFGVFDLFRSRKGNPTFLDDHLIRFDNSQQLMDLRPKVSIAEIKDAVSNLQDRNGFVESTFKLMLLADGPETDIELQPLFYIINTDISQVKNPSQASLISHEYVREYPEVKTISYFTSNMLHRRRRKANAIDVLYHLDGNVSEASRSNVFIVSEGVLKTPEDNILHGITRKHILKFAPDILETQVVDFGLDELFSADEVFISSTLKEIMPIISVDNCQIGGNEPGPWTIRLQNAFQEYIN